ncbi:MAG: hypothetical protein ACXWWR_05115 [Candidatus Limnocylindrales bacterium]
MTGPTEPSPPPEPTEPGDPAEPSRIPGETDPSVARRRLERAPGERLRPGSPAGATVAAAGSPTRAIGMGIVGAIVGVVAFLILAIAYTYTAGLVVVAIFTGRFVGLFVRAGAAGSLAPPARALVAIVIFLAALTVAILTTWLVAGLEGGVLPLDDYLEQAYGTPIVALEFMLGTLMAWWSAR